MCRDCKIHFKEFKIKSCTRKIFPRKKTNACFDDDVVCYLNEMTIPAGLVIRRFRPEYFLFPVSLVVCSPELSKLGVRWDFQVFSVQPLRIERRGFFNFHRGRSERRTGISFFGAMLRERTREEEPLKTVSKCFASDILLSASRIASLNV